MKLRRNLITLLPLLVMVTAVSCASLPAGTEYSSFTSTASRSFDNNIDECFHASEEVLEILGLEIVNSRGDAFSGEINALFSDGSKVRVSLLAITHDTTEIEVDTGYFGGGENKRRAMRIVTSINNLLNPPEEPKEPTPNITRRRIW